MATGAERGAEVLGDPGADPNFSLAHTLLTRRPTEGPVDLVAAYADDLAATRVETVEVPIDGPSAKVMYLTDMLLGNRDSDVQFLRDTIQRVADLPEDMQPDLVVMSGIVQGDFRYLEKRRRATLVDGLQTLDAQFAAARSVFEDAAKIGAPIVYNLGPDDHRIAEEATNSVFRMMHHYAKQSKPAEGNDTEPVSPIAIDKMRQNPNWDDHYKFQVNTVLPFCLRSGRRLYSAEEMARRTNGEITVEEYFVLFDAEERNKTEQEPNPAYAKWLAAAEQDMVDVIVTDGVDLEINTDTKTYYDAVRSKLGFSAAPMYQNHMGKTGALLGQMASHGDRVPDMTVITGNHEAVGVGVQGGWLESSGTLLDARRHFDTRGALGAVPSPAMRQARTRGRISHPSASSFERTDDGSMIWTVHNHGLQERSDSLPDRMTIAELCDFQTGSVTARPDLLAKYLDIIRTDALGRRATALFFGGDMLHGRNYPNFPMESQETGLMAMDSQEAFNLMLFEEAFAGATPEELQAITRVLVQPGNHEWNSGTLKWHGYSFVTYMRGFFERMLARGGYEDAEIKQIVKTHDAMLTAKGEHAVGYTGVEYFNEVGVLIQHYLLDRGGKGSGGDLPVYQAHHFATGAGDVFDSVDVFMAGHWHHPQHGLFGDKLAVVGGSIAGLSDYEAKRGYRATIAGTMIHLGGGLPPQVEFVSERKLAEHKIRTGSLTDEVLAEKGFVDDRGFDPGRHGIYAPRTAKSGLQKYLIERGRDISQRADTTAYLRSRRG